MDLSGISSTSVQPGPISLLDFAYSNIILTSAAEGSDYKLPNADALLQTFSVPDPTGRAITKVGDVWAKRYISQRTIDVNLVPSDASGSGSVVVKSNSGVPIVGMCYLLWITVDQPGDWSTLTGTYLIFGDEPGSAIPPNNVSVSSTPSKNASGAAKPSKNASSEATTSKNASSEATPSKDASGPGCTDVDEIPLRSILYFESYLFGK
jgi:hypothetical protein